MLNAAARLVFNARKYDHVSHLLCDLHWLRVPERIKFRQAVHVFRCCHNMAPPYLSRDFHWTDEAESLQRLRSGSQPRLIVPRTWLRTIGDRCFRVMDARYSPTSIALNVFDSLWDFSTTFRRRRNLLFQFRLQIFRRRVGIFSHFFLCCFYFLLKVHINFVQFSIGLGLSLDHRDIDRFAFIILFSC